MAETFAGFDSNDISQYFGVSPIAGKALTHVATDSPVDALPTTELEALQKIDPKRFQPGATSYNQGYGDIPFGLNHLFEHAKGSHYSGDFNISKLSINIGEALRRLFVIKESSFKPANLARAGAVVATAGTYAGASAAISGSALQTGSSSTLSLNPLDRLIQGFFSFTKISVNQIPITDGLSQRSDSLVQSYNIGVVSLGQTRSGDPSNRESSANRIARFSGGAAGAYGLTVGIAPYLAELSGPAATGLKTASSSFVGGQVSQVVVTVLGNKIGGALLALLSGDLQGAIKIISSNPSQPIVQNPSNPLLYGPSGGGGGGAGLGLGSQNTGQTSSNSVVYLLIAGILVISAVYLLRRK